MLRKSQVSGKEVPRMWRKVQRKCYGEQSKCKGSAEELPGKCLGNVKEVPRNSPGSAEVVSRELQGSTMGVWTHCKVHTVIHCITF